MRARPSRSRNLVAVLALSVAGLVALAAGCGGRETNGGSTREADDESREARAHRARQVAAAWDGSGAAAAWRAGYHPTGEVIQPPREGLHTKDDRQAYRDRSFALRGKLPAAATKKGQVSFAEGGALARPLEAAEESYEALVRSGAEPRLTVTGAKLGEMTVVTSRGPATVPAWLFSLKGYDTPLKQAAVTASGLPRSPVKPVAGPSTRLGGLVRSAVDARSVTVIAAHGVCDDGAVVDVTETSGSVVLSASVRGRRAGLCTKQAMLQRVTVQLGRPVGDRVLLDAHTGRPVPYRPWGAHLQAGDGVR
ncbi:hypothetical protein MMF93_32265 [Streptomyces tubbatahanensis]|uniref:Lipoprotein n=1 Tax=Streptomyces tubbatahanensis TaxID=2923272 RepID=A0ABY3Y220_9ACTN|nr:hypothetical protein [Streptomyces tubbatahanensis]UNT00634.1 hypothetical protein MMF93_32265 [Streptomyces tubbatahanensis]